jgi:regulator of sirC expression with transglutaminase-like and TPR domain
VAHSPPDSFAELVARTGLDVPLDRAAAFIAAEEQPGVDPQAILDALDALAARLRIPSGAPLVEQVARLNHLLFTECGFSGDDKDYDDPRNSLLDQVLSRRKGLPILLSVLTIEVGRRVGLALDGVAFPSHFLVGPSHAEPRFFLDPFHGGRILRQEHLIQRLMAMSGGRRVSAAELARYAAPASSRQILVRLNNNLKGSYLRRQDLDGVLRTIDRLLALDASLMGERRDRGWVLARLGRKVEAIDDLETYLLVHPSARDAEMVREHLEELRSGQD